MQEGFGVLSDLNLSFLDENTGRAVAEDARRLAAIAAGDFTGEAAKLLEQSNPELFKHVMGILRVVKIGQLRIVMMLQIILEFS